jgi:hypothetical protein
MSRRKAPRPKPDQGHALAKVPPGGAKAGGQRARKAPSTSLELDPPEAGGDRRAALLLACYRAAALHNDAPLALITLKLRFFSGEFSGGRVSFRAEGACLLGVYGGLTHLAQRVSNEALPPNDAAGPLREGDELAPHNLALLVRDARLAAEELESLRKAYKQTKTTTRRG